MRKLIVVFMFVLLFGCKKEQTSTGIAAEPPGDQRGAVSRVKALDVAGGVPALAPPEAESRRMIVRRADIRIIVNDTSKTIEAVTRTVEGTGGYVSDSNIWRDGELLRAKLTLRVPSNKLTATLASIRALAKRVDNETITSEDVSEQYVDLESRVRNLEATETELLELLKVARQSSRKASDVLEVHQQVSTIRGQIEQARGRMRYLSQVSSMSSIAVEVVPDAIAQPVVEPGWQPLVVVKDASRALVAVMQTLATAAIWFAIYVLPILGMLALLIVAAWRLFRRSRAREA